MCAPRDFNLRIEYDVITKQFSPELWDTFEVAAYLSTCGNHDSDDQRFALHLPHSSQTLTVVVIALHAMATGKDRLMHQHVSDRSAGMVLKCWQIKHHNP